MYKKTQLTVILYTFFIFSVSLYGLGEETFVLGGSSTWTVVDKRQGIIELPLLRPYPVLALSSIKPVNGLTLGSSGSGTAQQSIYLPELQHPSPSANGQSALRDLVMTFDQDDPKKFVDDTGHYALSVSPGVTASDQRIARTGSGAASFSVIASGDSMNREGAPLVLVPQDREALFAANKDVGDFSIEFWLYPMHLDNGEQILSWTAVRKTPKGDTLSQRIQCMAVKNRLQWSFHDLFSLPDDSRRIDISISSSVTVSPRVWTHHLVRFTANTGMVEYLVNGSLEGAAYATASGREGGDIYAPKTGTGGAFVLGSRFNGAMDEFRILSHSGEKSELAKYHSRGGWVESRVLDLGGRNSQVLMVEALGGRITIGGSISHPGKILQNEYAGAGNFRFSDDSALQFFIRAGDSPYQWANLIGAENEAAWIPFEPGLGLSAVYGRYMQLGIAFYPSGDGETSPYLEELRVTYKPDTPPTPPSLVTAFARDGGVDLSWKASSDPDLAGYLVYYGTARGVYFGEDAIQGVSPLDVGKRTSIHIDGLKNGVLYYFAVTAYDKLGPTHGGTFSREESARPLRKAE